MGSWGDNLFESDTALDYLNNLMTQIRSDIEIDLAQLGDGVLERPVGACVGILKMLCAGTRSARLNVEEPDVRRWQSTLNQWFDQVVEIDKFNSDSWNAYRANLTAEFEDLCALISQG